MKETKGTILKKLFFSTLYISAFTFGGGFVIITFMKRKFVDELHWIDMTEMLDLTALAQSSPGAIAVNAAILVGWRVAGLILSVISLCYQAFASNLYVALILKGMQAGVAAVILDVVCGLGSNVIKQKRPIFLVIMALAFLANVVWKVNVIYIILASALMGILLELMGRKRGEA